MKNGSEKFLELKFSFPFIPLLYALPSDVDYLIQRVRFYDIWTFAKLTNNLLLAYFRDHPEDYSQYKNDGVLIALTSQGFSGSSVFTIEFISIIRNDTLSDIDDRFKESCSQYVQATRTGKSFIVKIGPYHDISKEINNYGKHVKGVLDKAVYPELFASTSFIDKTAAILYERASNMIRFYDYYVNEKENVHIKLRVDYLFSKLKAPWYDQGVPTRHNLFETYHLSDRKERFLSSLREISPPDELRKRSINILGPGNVPLLQGRNPLDILEDSHLGTLKVLESPIHDDLNPYNIFVDKNNSNNIKIIDFAGTRCRPILQDLAKFEMSILFLLYDQKRANEPWALSPDPSQFRRNSRFQEWIIIAIRFIESIDKDDFHAEIPTDAETIKFFYAIDSIRNHARCYFYTDWALEYEIALFNWALRATYWNDSSPAKRVLAYYVACMLGQAIENRHSEITS